MDITYIMCQSGRLISAGSEHFPCHRYVWYIFLLACSVFVIGEIYHIMNTFNQVTDGRIIEYLSSNIIKHTLNILVHDVINLYVYIYNICNMLYLIYEYIYIYIYIYIFIYIEQILLKMKHQ